MPTVKVNGGTIAYDIFGKGPLLVWNAGGRSGRGARDYLIAGYFARHSSVLIWDRRNSEGASDVHLSDAPSATQADAEDLHAMLQTLDLRPACVGGGSAGCALSLFMAHRYPQDVASILAFYPGTRDLSVRARLSEKWYPFAEAANSGGMQAVIDLTVEAYKKRIVGVADRHDKRVAWLAKSFQANPTNRDKMLAMDPVQFSAMVRRWGDSVKLGDAVTEDEVRAIEVPALVISGKDDVHPPESATWLAECLPASETPVYEDPTKIQTHAERMAIHLPTIDGFLERTRLN